MTLEHAMELAEVERDLAQLERAIKHSSMAAGQRGSPENKMALERIGEKRVRLAELQATRQQEAKE